MSGGNIFKFYKKNAAEDADVVLEKAIGCYEDVLIIGWNKDGDLDPRANLKMNGRDILWLIEVFKAKLLNGDYDEN